MVSWLSLPVSCLLNSHTEFLAGNRWDKFLRSTGTGALPCQLLNSPPETRGGGGGGSLAGAFAGRAKTPYTFFRCWGLLKIERTFDP